MSVRRFTSASSEKITLSVGNLGFAFGPGTIAAVVFPTQVTVAAHVFTAGSVTSATYALRMSAAGKVTLVCNTTTPAAPAGLPAMTANAWFLIAATKATGTVAPRYHHYVYSTKTWTHIDSAATAANSGTPGTRAAFGTDNSGAAAFWQGDIAAAGVWNVVLTDAQIEALVLFSPAIPKGLWRLNQDSTGENVLDLTGGGADQSAIVGTSITNVVQPVGMMNMAPPKPVPSSPRPVAVTRSTVW